ncbi:MAG: ABC transporter ATP-binding protein, partial [Lachnospiraceae bacterium]|nr:ABC transporter ATP-binding protein [Lachnospiraceae bacterium]
MIELVDVCKGFGGQEVLRHIHLKIPEGSFVTLLGPSGCGKTTILRLIGGFESPDSGKIFLDGEDVTKLPPNKRNVNTIFQKYALFPHMNVFENIAFGLMVRKLSSDEIERKVKNALALVGLPDFERRNIRSLSGGQQQRIAIARAIVCEPEILLLDEPLGALDLKLRKSMQYELVKLKKELGITFLYVTHDQDEALTMSDTVVIMKDGRIQQTGSPVEVYDEPDNRFVADFIGESNIFEATYRGEEGSDGRVYFAGHEWMSVDRGFAQGEVDVVVRPEDIRLLREKTDDGMPGTILSILYRGSFYEI